MITVWHRLDRFLARPRPHRDPLSLLIDGAVVAIAWDITYLFRLGFERWLSARPAYDGWVLMLQLRQVPRAVLALHPVVSLMGLALVRLACRMVCEHGQARITGSNVEIRRVIVIGAGQAARRLLAGIHQQGWIVRGLLDDDPAKQGARIAGLPVLGPLAAIGDKAVRGAATHVIEAMPAAKASQRRRVWIWPRPRACRC